MQPLDFSNKGRVYSQEPPPQNNQSPPIEKENKLSLNHLVKTLMGLKSFLKLRKSQENPEGLDDHEIEMLKTIEENAEVMIQLMQFSNRGVDQEISLEKALLQIGIKIQTDGLKSIKLIIKTIFNSLDMKNIPNIISSIDGLALLVFLTLPMTIVSGKELINRGRLLVHANETYRFLSSKIDNYEGKDREEYLKTLAHFKSWIQVLSQSTSKSAFTFTLISSIYGIAGYNAISSSLNLYAGIRIPSSPYLGVIAETIEMGLDIFSATMSELDLRAIEKWLEESNIREAGLITQRLLGNDLKQEDLEQHLDLENLSQFQKIWQTLEEKIYSIQKPSIEKIPEFLYTTEPKHGEVMAIYSDLEKLGIYPTKIHSEKYRQIRESLELIILILGDRKAKSEDLLRKTVRLKGKEYHLLDVIQLVRDRVHTLKDQHGFGQTLRSLARLERLLKHPEEEIEPHPLAVTFLRELGINILYDILENKDTHAKREQLNALLTPTDRSESLRYEMNIKNARQHIQGIIEKQKTSHAKKGQQVENLLTEELLAKNPAEIIDSIRKRGIYLHRIVLDAKVSEFNKPYLKAQGEVTTLLQEIRNELHQENSNPTDLILRIKLEKWQQLNEYPETMKAIKEVLNGLIHQKKSPVTTFYGRKILSIFYREMDSKLIKDVQDKKISLEPMKDKIGKQMNDHLETLQSIEKTGMKRMIETKINVEKNQTHYNRNVSIAWVTFFFCLIIVEIALLITGIGVVCWPLTIAISLIFSFLIFAKIGVNRSYLKSTKPHLYQKTNMFTQFIDQIRRRKLSRIIKQISKLNVEEIDLIRKLQKIVKKEEEETELKKKEKLTRDGDKILKQIKEIGKKLEELKISQKEAEEKFQAYINPRIEAEHQDLTQTITHGWEKALGIAGEEQKTLTQHLLDIRKSLDDQEAPLRISAELEKLFPQTFNGAISFEEYKQFLSEFLIKSNDDIASQARQTRNYFVALNHLHLSSSK